jgi:hypothetical protein
MVTMALGCLLWQDTGEKDEQLEKKGATVSFFWSGSGVIEGLGK